MSEAILKKLEEKHAETNVAFQKLNDEMIAQKEAHGVTDVLLKEQVEKTNATLGNIEDEIAKIKANAGTSDHEKSELNAKQSEVYNKYFKSGYEALSPEDQVELKKLGAEFNEKANFSGSDVAGGFVVRPELSNSITSNVKENSPIRQIADSITIGTNEYVDLYDESDVGSGWVGETEARPETSSPSLDEIRIAVNEMYASPKATQNLLDDASISIESWLNGKVADKMSRLEGTAFVSGTGVKQPKGFLSYTAGTGFNKVENIQATAGASGAYGFDDLIAITDSLLDPYKANARWVMDKETRSSLRVLKDQDGQYLWQPDNQGGIASMLLGYAVTIAVDMPSLGSSTDSIAFGDFRRGYKIVDRQGIRILRDPYTDKPYVLFYTTKRVGGGVQDFQAIKIGKTVA